MYLAKLFSYSRNHATSILKHQIYLKQSYSFIHRKHKYLSQITKVNSLKYFTSDLFHTSPRRLLPPWLLVLYKLNGLKFLKGISVIFGRSGRKIYDKLPLSLQNQISRHKIVVYSSLGIASVILYYSYVHYDTCPLTGRRRWVSFTKSQILALAELDHKKLMEMYKTSFVDKDQPLFQICNEIMNVLVKQNSDIDIVKDINWNLNIIADENMCNAFVLPNGQVYLFTGMVKLMNDWEELAIVLSHEMAHTILGHVQEQQSFIVFGEILVIPILTFLWFLLEDVTAFLVMLIEKYVFSLIFEVGFNLPYSRLLETEADIVGLTLSTKACFDPRWAVLLWEKMSFKELLDDLFANRKEVSDIKYLSTHPANDERAVALENKIPEMLQMRKKCDCGNLSSIDPIEKALVFRKLSANIRERLDIEKKKKAIEWSLDLEKSENSDVKLHVMKLEKALKQLTAEWDAIVERENQTVVTAYELFGYKTKSLSTAKEVSSQSDKLFKIFSNNLLSPDPTLYIKKKQRDYYTSVYF